MNAILAIILAAGKGTRMRSQFPKVLHQVAELPMLGHVLGLIQGDNAQHVVVTGHHSEQVSEYVQSCYPDCQIVKQEPQLGTAHAVLQAREMLQNHQGDVVVLYGDTPLLQPSTIAAMQDMRQNGLDLVVLGFNVADTNQPYGRLLMEGERLTGIIEYADADDEQRALSLCNSGVLLMEAHKLLSLLEQVDNHNAKEEYYLTDVVGLAVKAGWQCGVRLGSEEEVLGVNSRNELAVAEQIYQNRLRKNFMQAGVTLIDPQSVYFSYDTLIGRDCLVEPNVIFGPGVQIADNVRIRAFSYLQQARIASGCVVGPFARLRPGTDLKDNVHIGNFVEIKKSQLGVGTKVNHLSYIGDAMVGEYVNIGAGTITCNYDGFAKHMTKIGDGAFIGSNTLAVAPVKIGAGAYTASGSVITNDLPDGSLGVGRAQTSVRKGWVERFRARKMAQ